MNTGVTILGVVLLIIGLIFTVITLGIGIICSWPLILIGIILIIVGLVLEDSKPAAYYPGQQQTNARFCPACGRSIPFDAVICPYCGKKY
jgi:hypothetical protein